MKLKDESASAAVHFQYSESDLLDSLDQYLANELRKLDLTDAQILEVVADVAGPEDVETVARLLSE